MNIPAWLKTLPDEALRSIELREWHDDEVDAYVELLNKHHYLNVSTRSQAPPQPSCLLPRQSGGINNLDNQQP